MSFLEYMKERKKQQETARVFIDGEEKLIKDIPDKSITPAVYRILKTNSVGWRLLIPKYDDEALVLVTQHYLENSGTDSIHTYDGALKGFVVPELLKRLEERNGRSNPNQN